MTNSAPKAPPMHDRDGFIWMDGKMVPWREAKVHFLTHGLHYGTAVFEGERAYNGVIFKSRQHTDRLFKSAQIIKMPMTFTPDQIETAKKEVLEANKLKNCYVRVLAWRGSEVMGLDPTLTLPHVGIAAWDWAKYFDSKTADMGVSLGMSKWRRPSPDTAPIHAKASSLYNLGAIAKLEALEAGYSEALMLDFEGYIAEATAANFFAVKNGELHTPMADRFLNGITRQTVIELAKELKIPVAERRIKPEELKDFDEVFLTGSAAEITGVSKIDGHHYQVGPMTRKLRDAYSALMRK